MEFISGSLLYSVAKDIARAGGTHLKTSEKFSISAFEQHILWSEGWSRHIQMFGMTKPLTVDRESISLSISDRPRKFFAPDAPADNRTLHTEDTLIANSDNYLILGDPGCGKTTLFKRLTRRLILEEQSTSTDKIDAPIVILGRDLFSNNTIFHKLCNIFGIDIISFDASHFKSELDQYTDWEKRNRRVRELKQAWIENSNAAARALMLQTLTSRGFALLIDGIDEINTDYRADFEKDLDDIINTCTYLKVLCTCRAGDWTRSITSLNILAVEALSDTEISDIVSLWATKPDNFLTEIQYVPYKEVLDRPLFLTLLIIIYNQGYKLPDCPVDVYERIIWLLIDRWDKERDIFRESKFSSFLSEKKLRFLSNIAFDLTFKSGKKRFSTKSLELLYRSICPRFKLPENDFKSVLEEIESHTGIIVESGFDHFEFCHLTVQEFLAAKHLVGLARPPQIADILEASPATLAVASSLSADPSSYVARVLDTFGEEELRKAKLNQADDLIAIIPYLSRLRLELPELSVSNSLGMAMLKFFSAITTHRLRRSKEHSTELIESVLAFLDLNPAKDSLRLIVDRVGVQSINESDDTVSVMTVGKIFTFDRQFFDRLGLDENR